MKNIGRVIYYDNGSSEVLRCNIQDLHEGDIFMLYDNDYRPIWSYNHYQFKALSEPYQDNNGLWRINSDYADDRVTMIGINMAKR